MPDRPPSDPADYAEDFSRRYGQELDIAAGETLVDLGIDPNRLAALDPEDLQRKAFLPGERTVGSLGPGGTIMLESGVMNPDAMDAPLRQGGGRLLAEAPDPRPDASRRDA